MHLGVAALQDHPPRSVYKAQSNDPGGWRPLWHQVEDPLDLGKLLHLMGVGTWQGRERLPHAGVVTWHPRQNSAQTLPKNLLNISVFSGNALTVFAQLNTLRALCADWTAPRISFCSLSALWKEWVWIWTSFRRMTKYAHNWGNTRAHQSKAKSDETRKKRPPIITSTEVLRLSQTSLLEGEFPFDVIFFFLFPWLQRKHEYAKVISS